MLARAALSIHSLDGSMGARSTLLIYGLRPYTSSVPDSLFHFPAKLSLTVTGVPDLCWGFLADPVWQMVNSKWTCSLQLFYFLSTQTLYTTNGLTLNTQLWGHLRVGLQNTLKRLPVWLLCKKFSETLVFQWLLHNSTGTLCTLQFFDGRISPIFRHCLY